MSFFITDALADTTHAATTAPNAGISALLMPLVFLVVFYFLLWRPQSKKAKEQKAMVDSIQKGDEVVTSGGLLGKVSAISEQYLSLVISDEVTIKIQRAAINNVLPKGTIKSIN